MESFVDNLQKQLSNMQRALSVAQTYKIDLSVLKKPKGDIFKDFRRQREENCCLLFNNSLAAMKKALIGYNKVPCVGSNAGFDKLPEVFSLLSSIDENYKKKEIDAVKKGIDELAMLLDSMQERPHRNKASMFSVPRVPLVIREEVEADVEELRRCFESACYRSAMILCGRILETALHRKYYEASKNDLLETCPGIGLGKLIAKLKEANVKMPPGLNEQIHLINNVRINSVHTKKIPFRPSARQSEAIILYTLETLNNLF